MQLPRENVFTSLSHVLNIISRKTIVGLVVVLLGYGLFSFVVDSYNKSQCKCTNKCVTRTGKLGTLLLAVLFHFRIYWDLSQFSKSRYLKNCIFSKPSAKKVIFHLQLQKFGCFLNVWFSIEINKKLSIFYVHWS